MRRLAIMLLLVLVTQACGGDAALPVSIATWTATPEFTQDRAAQEDDIREAVFRHLFEHNASGLQSNAYAYFLSVEQTIGVAEDPSDSFMQRFDGHHPPVKKVSLSASVSTYGCGQLTDAATGQPALLFWARPIEWINDSEVQIEGGYGEGCLSASRNLYHLAKIGDDWVVADYRIIAIS